MTAVLSDEDVKSLPRMARIALAARCGRRAEPWLRYSNDSYLIELADLIPAAEAVAGGQEERKLGPSHVEYDKKDGLGLVRKQAARCASDVAKASAFGEPEYVIGAATWLCRIVGFIKQIQSATIEFVDADELREYVVAEVRRDQRHLADLAAIQEWTDKTIVPLSVFEFEDLWSDGLPIGWAVEGGYYAGEGR